jgi:hypothetical protein
MTMTEIKNHVSPEATTIFECDCCDRELPANRMVWAKDEKGNVLCYGKSCWKKIKRREG